MLLLQGSSFRTPGEANGCLCWSQSFGGGCATEKSTIQCRQRKTVHVQRWWVSFCHAQMCISPSLDSIMFSVSNRRRRPDEQDWPYHLFRRRWHLAVCLQFIPGGYRIPHSNPLIMWPLISYFRFAPLMCCSSYLFDSKHFIFQENVPPVMAFHLGSLGFLSPFEFDEFKTKVTSVLQGESM